jgi:hypothetical protein
MRYTRKPLLVLATVCLVPVALASYIGCWGYHGGGCYINAEYSIFYNVTAWHVNCGGDIYEGFLGGNELHGLCGEDAYFYSDGLPRVIAWG